MRFIGDGRSWGEYVGQISTFQRPLELETFVSDLFVFNQFNNEKSNHVGIASAWVNQRELFKHPCDWEEGCFLELSDLQKGCRNAGWISKNDKTLSGGIDRRYAICRSCHRRIPFCLRISSIFMNLKFDSSPTSESSDVHRYQLFQINSFTG